MIVLPVIPLSASARAVLTAKRDALKAASLTFTPATHNLFTALDPAAIASGESDRREQVSFLQKGLAETHRNFLRAFGDALTCVRAAMRQPLLDYVAAQIESALSPIFKSKIIRRQVVRRSQLYRNTAAVFDRVEQIELLPVAALHGQVQACLLLCDAVLAGHRMSIDPTTNNFSVGCP